MSAPDTSWITPGADVVIYTSGHRATATFYVTKVKTVAAKSFTVERDQVTERFSLATLETKNIGSTYSSWRYVATQPGSEKHQELIEIERVRRLVSEAHSRVEGWLRKRTDPAASRAASEALHSLAVSLELRDGGVL